MVTRIYPWQRRFLAAHGIDPDAAQALLDQVDQVDQAQLDQLCVCCEQRAAGHGHYALYCEPCAEQPLWGCRH